MAADHEVRYAVLYLRQLPKVPIKKQIRDAMKVAARRGWSIVHRIEEDDSRMLAQPHLRDVVKACRQKHVSVLIVYDLLVLAREALTLMRLLRSLDEDNVEVVAVDGTLDTSQVRKLTLIETCVLLLDVEERGDQLRAREARALARRRGGRVGRPTHPLTPTQAAEALEEHGTLTAAAKAVGVSTKTLSGRLKRYRVESAAAALARPLQASDPSDPSDPGALRHEAP